MMMMTVVLLMIALSIVAAAAWRATRPEPAYQPVYARVSSRRRR
jgi:hypothetical protein